MSRIIEAKAVISAEDRTGKAFDAIARKFREVGKGAKASVEVGRLAKQIDAANTGLRNIEKFRSTQQAFGAARANYRATQLEVGRIAKELDGARKAAKAFDGIRSFSKSGGIAGEIAAAKKQVVELERQFSTAQRAVKAASAGFESHIAAMKGAKQGYEASVGSVGKLVSDQARLKAAIEGTNAAILKQEALVRAEGRMTGGMGEHGRRQAARIAQDRYLVDGMGAPGRQSRAHAEQLAAERHQLMLDQRQSRRDAAQTLGGMGGLYLGHKVNEGTKATLDTYRDFDKYKRQTQAFGNFSDGEMERIVDMAIHGGASTRYNDIQWLQGAKALGGRGVKSGSVMSILPEAAQYGQAMSTDLPDAVAGLEGSLFAFKRDLSTPEAAQAAARRTADLQVGAAKAFGLTHHDLKGGYEYGALGAETTGLGEEKLLAFLGLGKKLNIDGITQGNAWRAMTSKFLSPTRKGREALAGVGVDYSARQQMPERLSVDNFANMIAQQYGVKLDKGARSKLDAGFTNKSVFSDASAFAVMVKGALKGQVGINGAKDSNKVAGSAERFRQTNVEKVDVNGLFDDVMNAIKGGNLALANAIFGEKQGNRIMAALRDKDVWNESLKKVQQTPEGKAKDVADKMNAGFDGALARFEGSVKNLETAMGRSWDNDGKGGFLTGLANAAAKATQSLAEMPKGVLQAASGALWAGGKVATSAGTLALVGAAFSLKGSAAALTAAAARLGLGGLPGTVPGAVKGGGAAAGAAAGAAGAAGAASKGSKFIKAAKAVGGFTAVGALATLAQDYDILQPPEAKDGWGKGALKFLDPRLADLVYGSDKAAAPVAPNQPAAKPGREFGAMRRVPLPPRRPGSLGGQESVTLPEQSVTAAPGVNAGEIERATAALAAYKAELATLKSEMSGLSDLGLPGLGAGQEKRAAELDALIQKAETYQQKLKGADPSGQVAAVNNTLDKATTASSTAANGGKPIEATVKPDQITAKVESLPPVTGEANVNVESKLNVVMTLNEPMLQAKIDSSVGRATAKMNLSSSGARPGAVSMPGAASTPGAQ